MAREIETKLNLINNDNVEHPKHYCRENAMECIDEMLLVFGEEAVKHFCLCNAWKYRYRAADKNGEEDIKKSDWYLRKYKEFQKKEKNLGTITIGSGSVSELYSPSISLDNTIVPL